MASRRLCASEELPEGGERGFRIEGDDGAELRVLAVRRDGIVRAFVNRCPHRGTPLDWSPGRFLDADGQHLVCATHGARFRVEDGLCLAGPCAGDRLQPVYTHERDGGIWLA